VTDLLFSIDTAVFFFINRTLSNPFTDMLWPVITGYDRFLSVRIVLLAAWVWLIVRGGRRGRTAALLLIPVIAIADQLSSAVLKEWIARPRPCHTVAGVPILQGIRLLVECGPGKSFPSSHAVNNFGFATLFAHYYPRWAWAFFSWAAVVGISRVAVGVHFPSDVVGGAVIGMLVALLVIAAWTAVQRRFIPAFSIEDRKQPEQ